VLAALPEVMRYAGFEQRWLIEPWRRSGLNVDALRPAPDIMLWAVMTWWPAAG
jgi:hypothetical protein